jgi:hypothetical protein
MQGTARMGKLQKQECLKKMGSQQKKCHQQQKKMCLRSELEDCSVQNKSLFNQTSKES